jgi:hypothetical protein
MDATALVIALGIIALGVVLVGIVAGAAERIAFRRAADWRGENGSRGSR